MALNNTGNSVPSTAVLDFQDNVQVLDSLLNGDAIEVTARTGKELKSIAYLQNVLTSLDVGSFTFSDTATGISGTTDGQYFRTPHDDSFFYYRNDNGTAVYVASIASYESIQYLQNALAGTSGLVYKGDGPVYPIAIDRESNVIIGYNSQTDTIVAPGIDNHLRFLSEHGEVLSSPEFIYPLLIDSQNNVILGYDAKADSIIGAGIRDFLKLLSANRQAESLSDSVYPLLIDSQNNVVLGYDAEQDRVIGSGIGKTSEWKDEPFPYSIAMKAINQNFSYGQSLSMGAYGAPALSLTQPFNNVMFKGGVLGTDYSAFAPLVEATQETVCSCAANYFDLASQKENGIGAGNFVTLTSAPGAPGQRITQLNKGTDRYDKYLLPQIKGGYALNNDLHIDTVFWMQGEADSGDGDYHVETLESYKALFTALINDINADVKAATSQENPVIFLTYQHSSYTQEGNTQEAFLQMEQEDDRVYVIFPTYFLPHISDRLHLTSVGYKWAGSYFGRARKQILIDKIKPKRIRAISATHYGNKIHVKFIVPNPPLSFDTLLMPETENYGFCVKSGDDILSVQSLSVSGGDTVIITMSENIVGDNIQVRYAYDYNGANQLKGSSGNLTDSCEDYVIISGNKYPMPYVCPHFKITSLSEAI
ncbi:sialate O-acetylesterase [Tatumella sp. UCD-D_suzukii]|uniref:sialate O-acetylesterase n=1 Tax=Tatumella sp. UCD-D_suzukii TaxID=1408192 RepID=UPI000470E96B|nr:sialate O-acetylesterase [Tatumella sp. UCD-D_suzukii]